MHISSNIYLSNIYPSNIYLSNIYLSNKFPSIYVSIQGNESTSPPTNIAVAFANNLCYSEGIKILVSNHLFIYLFYFYISLSIYLSIYVIGMPGPSYTWSAFSSNLIDAIDILKSDRMVTLVTERLDESLVVSSHFLG
jgi:hypothetical protein